MASTEGGKWRPLLRKEIKPKQKNKVKREREKEREKEGDRGRQREILNPF